MFVPLAELSRRMTFAVDAPLKPNHHLVLSRRISSLCLLQCPRYAGLYWCLIVSVASYCLYRRLTRMCVSSCSGDRWCESGGQQTHLWRRPRLLGNDSGSSSGGSSQRQ